jgi:NAD+ diphosphatase
MRQQLAVTFGDSGLDRAAIVRGDPEKLARHLTEGRILPLWRGKPLLAEQDAGLGWIAAGHPVLPPDADLVFLGLEDGIGSFAVDLSGWQPEAAALPEQGLFDDTRQAHPLLPAGQGFEDLRNQMTRLTPREAELAATARALLQWHQSHRFCSACGAPSKMVQAGWQRHCPACNTQHFPRTDPVVIMLVTHGNRVLLGRSPGWPEGMYSLLAGFLEPGETVEAAVRREVAEESGVQVGEVVFLASQPWPFPASLMLGCRAEATTDAITIDPVELEDACWVTREELVQVFAGRHPKIRPGRKGAIAHHLLRNWLADCAN